MLVGQRQFFAERGHAIGAYESDSTYRNRRRSGAVERVMRHQSKADDVSLFIGGHLERCVTEIVTHVDTRAMLGHDAFRNAGRQVSFTQSSEDYVFEFVVLEDAVSFGRYADDSVRVLTHVTPSVGGNPILGEEGNRLHAEAVCVLVTDDFLDVVTALVHTSPVEGSCFVFVDVTHGCIVGGIGRADRTRTCNILLPKQGLYQLRYCPMCVLVDVLGDGILVHEILEDSHEKFATADFESVLDVGVVDEFGDVLVGLACTCNPFVVVAHAPVQLSHVVLQVFV